MTDRRLEPLASMPPDLASAIDGVVFDVDDTVTRDGRLERAAYDAMWRLHERGVRLVAVTGRPLGWVDVIARHWPVDVAVGENGAGWVWREGAKIREGYFHDDVERLAHAELLAGVRERVAAAMPEARLAADQRARRCDLAYDVGEELSLGQEDIARLTAIIEAEGARVAVSSVHAHVLAGGWDKARGTARAIAEALGRDLAPEAERSRWLFAGDSGNDAAAFAWFPISVGVANVRAHLHALPVPPRWITTADRGRGFAEIAAHVLAHRPI